MIFYLLLRLLCHIFLKCKDLQLISEGALRLRVVTRDIAAFSGLQNDCSKVAKIDGCKCVLQDLFFPKNSITELQLGNILG